MNDLWGEGVMMDSLSGLLADREERVLVSESALKAMAKEDDQEDRNGEDLKSDSKR